MNHSKPDFSSNEVVTCLYMGENWKLARKEAILISFSLVKILKRLYCRETVCGYISRRFNHLVWSKSSIYNYQRDKEGERERTHDTFEGCTSLSLWMNPAMSWHGAKGFPGGREIKLDPELKPSAAIYASLNLLSSYSRHPVEDDFRPPPPLEPPRQPPWQPLPSGVPAHTSPSLEPSFLTFASK